MKDLIEMVQIVTKSKLKGVELLTDEKQKQSKLQEFYDGIAAGQLKSDEAAATQLYQEDKQSPAYQKLRKSLRDRLINSLFVIDLKQSSYTDRQKAYYECYKEWVAAKILLGKGARSAATSLAHKVLKISRHFEFTEMNVDIYRALRLHYGTIEGDLHKFHKYDSELQEFEALWQAESKAEQYYITLSIGAVNNKSLKADYYGLAMSSFSELEPLLKRFESYYLHLCARLIEASVFYSSGDYANTCRVCDAAITFFEKKPYTARVPLQIFHYQKAISEILAGRVEDGAGSIRESLKYAEEGTFNWFKSHELSFLIGLRQKRYAECNSVMQQILGHPNFNNLPENIQGIWKTAQAYLYFLQQSGKLQLGQHTSSSIHSFRLARFQNEMKVFLKDKQGMNLHVILIEILFYLLNAQTDQLIDRAEALDKYRTRYLQGDNSRRSNLFLKLLLQIPKSGFQKDDILEKTAKDLATLQAIPIQMVNQTLEMEILPYEVLWEYVLELLH